jgi:hypothetical protein
MQHGRHRAPTRPRAARRVVVLVLSLVLALSLGLSAADAEPGHGKGKPGTPGQAAGKAGDKTDDKQKPEEPEPYVSPGTIEANASYGYPWPTSPDCDESTVSSSGCINDGRGFFQGQCTSWVAHRLSQLNGISFTNWYAGRHWGNADQWAAVAKSIKIKPSEKPRPGDVAWFARGHVAYVENVKQDGSILMSEMNFDGHNDFRMVTLYPGGAGWPDKFIHVADMVPGASTVVPVDTTAPTVPSDLRVVHHRGRIGVDWQPSADEWGVAGYRISRSGADLATTEADTTQYWDQQVSPGQAYSYSVVAYDAAGNESEPATVDVGQPAEAADRAWVTTDAGPALCGRTGDLAGQRLGCTVLTRKGWQFAGLGRDTNWGRPGTRSFVESGDGSVSYCRILGQPRPRNGLACTTLDPDTMAWGYDRIAGPTDPTLDEDRTWVSTEAGPALCGLTGGSAHQRVGCSVLTETGWSFAGTGHDTAWGRPGSRAFLGNADGSVSYCRLVQGAAGASRTSCTSFDAARLRWGANRIAGNPDLTAEDNRTWVSTSEGPALCGRTGSDLGQRLGCSVLRDRGWTFTGLGRSTAWGDPASRAFLSSGTDGVSFCRTVEGPAGDRAACTRFDTERRVWGPDRVARDVVRTQAESRTWQETDSGPALCGRGGDLAHQRLSCSVLTPQGWKVPARDAAWGDTGTFVTSAEGDLSYCRGLTPPGGPARLVCTALEVSGRVWGRNRVSGPARLTIPDPF